LAIKFIAPRKEKVPIGAPTASANKFMNAIITKRWNFDDYGGANHYPKGMVIRGGRWFEKGYLIDHFYAYGQNEIIPATHCKPLKKKSRKVVKKRFAPVRYTKKLKKFITTFKGPATIVDGVYYDIHGRAMSE
jgi:hypothetical protein